MLDITIVLTYSGRVHEWEAHDSQRGVRGDVGIGWVNEDLFVRRKGIPEIMGFSHLYLELWNKEIHYIVFMRLTHKNFKCKN